MILVNLAFLTKCASGSLDAGRVGVGLSDEVHTPGSQGFLQNLVQTNDHIDEIGDDFLEGK